MEQPSPSTSFGRPDVPPAQVAERVAAGQAIRRRARKSLLFILWGFLGCLTSGCASITFPAYGIPVYRLPDELLSPPKDDQQTVNLAWLRQPAPGEYLLAPGDVLGVWVAGVLGATEQGPPVQASTQRNTPPATGIPIQVRLDGTIHLPLVEAISVEGLTVNQAEEQIRRAYLETGVLAGGRERVLVSLMHERTYSVIVVRQEQGVANAPRQFGQFTASPTARFKRGTGHLVELPAYRNDVLTALAESGGLPGLDAYNEIIIFRGAFRSPEDRETVLKLFENGPPDMAGTCLTRIPLRAGPGEPLQLTPEDIVLQTGDVVYIEARDPDVFYTGGLMPTGEWPLPRDYDLDILEAIALIQGPLFSGGLQTNNFLLSQQLLEGEFGGPSPSLALVIRQTGDGNQIPIRVDLNRALTDATERIAIHPGDFVVLQQTSEEALARYLTGVLRFDFVWKFLESEDAIGIATGRFPDRLPVNFRTFP